MNYIQFDFITDSNDQSDQLIALLNEQAFEGFEETEDSLQAFIAEDKFDDKAFSEMLTLFPSVAYTRTIVENINWNQQWESGFEPVLVDHFVAIRAHFHQPVANVEHEIVITPKMSFGTGHHATTYLMLNKMKELDFKGKTVLDFGTGTGVLAILAEKLGAEKLLAIDNDDWSIENAKENVERNNCTKIILEQHDAIPENKTFNIILANINLNIILANLGSIKLSAEKGAQILLSGFLKENEAQMIEALQQASLQYISTSQRGDWITILCKN